MSITDELREYARIHQPYKSELYNAQCADELTAIADRIDAAVEGMVELPKDADGEYIHVGDVMELVSYDEDYRPVIRTVDAVGEQVFFAWSKVDGRYAQYEACAYRHHHAPTVEDVLREFAYGLGVPVADSYVAATAAKLKLAEGEDA